MDDYVKSLPDDWRHDRLKDVALLRSEKTDEKSSMEDYLELEDIESWSMRILNWRNTEEVESAVTKFEKGDVLFGKLRPYLAKVCRPDKSGKCTGEILAIHPTHIDGGYLQYALIDPEMIKKCTLFSYGAKMPRVNWATQLSTFEIPIPPRPEQERIAALLDEKCATVYKAIEVKRKQLESVDAIWKNLLYRATTQGVEGIGRDARPHGLAGDGHTGRMPLPSGWRYARLKDCFSYGKGLNITKIDLVEDGTPVISYGQIHAKQNDGTHLKDELLRYVPDDLAQSNSGAKLKIGDIVFADTSEDLDGIGNCVINDVGDGVYAGYHTLIARAKDPRNSKYLSYLFQTDCWREQLRKRACGIKVFSLTQRLLSNVKVVLPPHGEQKLIVKYLDARHNELESLAVNLQRQIDTLEQYRKSLIHEFVTGVRRVV